MSLQETYRRIGPAAAALDDTRASAIVAEAMPHVVATLGQPVGTRLPVSAQRVDPPDARGGSLIPAWPTPQPDGSVVIQYVLDWGALLAGWVGGMDDAAGQSLAADLVRTGQRQWIGIANDVLQLFVSDPPPGAYSMVRHHALMLAAATAWLGGDAIRMWRAAHAHSATRFVRQHTQLWAGIEQAESGLDALLHDPRAHQAAPLALAWLDTDPETAACYVDYMAAASLGVAAVLQAMPQDTDVSAWLMRAVAELHPQPEFNRDWIEDCARKLARGMAV